MRRLLPYSFSLFLLCSPAAAAETTSSAEGFTLKVDEESGQLSAFLDGKEAFVYHFAGPRDLPHFFPLNTPSGKNILEARAHPWPHHRGFWIADTVERDGVRGDVYNSYYSGRKTDKGHEAPFDTGVRHDSFLQTTSTEEGIATVEEELVWETNRTSGTFPLLKEHRLTKLYPLGEGQWLMDLSFELRADYGDVKFVSDAVHYAWPYLRIHPRFSGEQGGTITSDSGATGQKETNLKPAKWIDYSNNVEGTSEGLAILQYPDGGPDRLWLTREYGTFGPRRPEEQSGKPFTLKKGEALRQRVGILVHRGDVDTGHVAEIYDRYTKGEFK